MPVVPIVYLHASICPQVNYTYEFHLSHMYDLFTIVHRIQHWHTPLNKPYRQFEIKSKRWVSLTCMPMYINTTRMCLHPTYTNISVCVCMFEHGALPYLCITIVQRYWLLQYAFHPEQAAVTKPRRVTWRCGIQQQSILCAFVPPVCVGDAMVRVICVCVSVSVFNLEDVADEGEHSDNLKPHKAQIGWF